MKAYQNGCYADSDLLPLLTLEVWSMRPPTKDEIISSGGTIGKIDCSRTISYGDIQNQNPKNVYTSIHSATDISNHVAPTQDTRIDAKVQKVFPRWASQLFVIKVLNNDRYVRVGTIARDRTTKCLYMFDAYGHFITLMKTRKHVTPSFVASYTNVSADMIRLDCIQCDAIKKSHKPKHTNVSGKPGIAKSPSLWTGNKNQRSYDPAYTGSDIVEMPPIASVKHDNKAPIQTLEARSAKLEAFRKRDHRPMVEVVGSRH